MYIVWFYDPNTGWVNDEEFETLSQATDYLVEERRLFPSVKYKLTSKE